MLNTASDNVGYGKVNAFDSAASNLLLGSDCLLDLSGCGARTVSGALDDLLDLDCLPVLCKPPCLLELGICVPICQLRPDLCSSPKCLEDVELSPLNDFDGDGLANLFELKLKNAAQLLFDPCNENSDGGTSNPLDNIPDGYDMIGKDNTIPISFDSPEEKLKHSGPGIAVYLEIRKFEHADDAMDNFCFFLRGSSLSSCEDGEPWIPLGIIGTGGLTPAEGKAGVVDGFRRFNRHDYYEDHDEICCNFKQWGWATHLSEDIRKWALQGSLSNPPDTKFLNQPAYLPDHWPGQLPTLGGSFLLLDVDEDSCFDDDPDEYYLAEGKWVNGCSITPASIPGNPNTFELMLALLGAPGSVQELQDSSGQVSNKCLPLIDKNSAEKMADICFNVSVQDLQKQPLNFCQVAVATAVWRTPVAQLIQNPLSTLPPDLSGYCPPDVTAE